MEKKPIKRNENILILSREHHSGLLFCWKIRQGLKRGADSLRIKNYVAYFWREHLEQHFEEEEEHLFLKMQDAMCQEALQQHRQIKALVDKVTLPVAAPAPELLTQLADLVDNHIRFEERQLFPHLEQTLDEQELLRVGAALEASHTTPHQDDYADEFWVKGK